MSRIRQRDESDEVDEPAKRVRTNLNDTTSDATNDLMMNDKVDCESLADGGQMTDDEPANHTRLISRISAAALEVNSNDTSLLRVNIQSSEMLMVNDDIEPPLSVSSSIHSSMAARSGDSMLPGPDWWSNHYWFMGEQGEDM